MNLNWRNFCLVVLISLLTSANVLASSASQGDWTQPSDIKWAIAIGADTMWGGTNVWISADRRVFLQNVRTMEEERYEAKLDETSYMDFVRFIANHDFREAKSRTTGITDVHHQLLCIGLASGNVASKSIVEKTENVDFNLAVRKIETIAQGSVLKKIYSGRYDYLWAPPGFSKQLIKKCFSS
jgi:hypothetical protein